MGKRLCGFTSKKTGIQYSLRLLPIGGYVAMAGEDEGGEGAGDPNAFCKKNVWQRMLILAAGAGMNVLTGFLAMLILTAGLTASGYRLPSTPSSILPPGRPAMSPDWRKATPCSVSVTRRYTQATSWHMKSCSRGTSRLTFW